MLEKKSLVLLEEALEYLQSGFAQLPEVQTGYDLEAFRGVLKEVATRLHDNYPYFHPLYAGQMLKPPHPIARLAYALSLWINPNNHALDGGRASSAMEKEAVAQLAAMFGWQRHLGHLCGGGTMANLEALWVAGQLHPGRKILASAQAHYTHTRLCGVLGLPFETVPGDDELRMDVRALEDRLTGGDIGTVVVTLGTTVAGSVDPLPEILRLQTGYGFRIHADAAYGGYFTLAANLDPRTRHAYDSLNRVDSIVVDPHKHGLQPYGCGSVLFRDPGVGSLYAHDSPYTYFSSAELHLGEISLECSRPGAAAVALWATQRLFPLIRGGEFANQLGKCRLAALTLFERLAGDSRFIAPLRPELDIVLWLPRATCASEASRLARQIFQAAARENLHLATARLPVALFQRAFPALEADQPEVTCLRSCLMKPEHLEWLDTLWEVLDRTTDRVLGETAP